MPDESAAKLREAWELRANACVTEFELGEHSYQIDFNAMTQTNTSSKKVRKIRHTVPAPPHWVRPVTPSTKSKADEYLQDMSRWPARYEELKRAIETIMKRSSLPNSHKGVTLLPITQSSCECLQRIKVHKVYQIENWQLYQAYLDGKRRLERQLDALDSTHRAEALWPSPPPVFAEYSADLKTAPLDTRLNECYAFHGAGLAKFQKIADSGFDFREAGAVTYYGAGTYFATNACKSHQYTTETNGAAVCCLGGGGTRIGETSGRRHMVLSRVLLGRIHYAAELCREVKKPPLGADSIVANAGPMPGHHLKVQAHQELVVFDRDQALPEFIIEYAVEPESAVFP